jgi:hypothetical protein
MGVYVVSLRRGRGYYVDGGRGYRKVGARVMGAFADIGYREDGPEEVNAVAGSVRTPAHAAHVARELPRLPMNNASPMADAALDCIYQILSERKAKRRGAVVSPRRFEACI